MCFGSDIWARQLEHSIGGLQCQGHCVEMLSVEAVEISMLMCDDFLLLFPKRLCMPVFRLSLCIQQPE